MKKHLIGYYIGLLLIVAVTTYGLVKHRAPVEKHMGPIKAVQCITADGIYCWLQRANEEIVISHFVEMGNTFVLQGPVNIKDIVYIDTPQGSKIVKIVPEPPKK